MRFFDTVRHILYADNFVCQYRADDEHRNQRGIALIAAAAFIIMSILNVRQESYVMLATTGISAVFLIIGYLISKYKNISTFLRVIFYIIFIVIFTNYTIMGGNEGFAALWLVIATYAVMITIDLKAGLAISLYYLIMLLLIFLGPLSFLLQFDYNETFMLRFPFLYAVNFAFATYISIRIRLYQYELLLKQQELEHLGTTDLSTGLMNRNYFIQYEQGFRYDNLETLSAVFIDVNGLHEINNSQGHDAGDRMLHAIAELCKKQFVDGDIFRMGGDEFLVICKNSAKDHIVDTAQELFNLVEKVGYSISYGIGMQESDFNLGKLVKDADGRMMKFKCDYYMHANRRKR